MDVSKYVSVFYRTKADNPNGPKMVQPYLLFSTDDNDTGDFYLKANDLTVHLGPSPLQAFTILMKYHHVFDVNYDSDLNHFFTFFEYIFGIPGAKLTTSMLEFLVKLRNVSLS